MSLKLLIVDSDEVSVARMARVFNIQGAEVRVADDGAAALVLINQAKFDGIFLEVSLADVDGMTFTQRIRQSAWNAKTPIVLLGKGADTRIAARAFQAGATFFLAKPLHEQAIRRALKSTRAVMLDERRRYRRIPLSTSLQCVMRGREMADCGTLNISLSGMLFEEDGTLQPHNPVRLAFRLEQGQPLIIASGVVVRVDERKRAGVRFTSVSMDDRERIRKRIAREVDNL